MEKNCLNLPPTYNASREVVVVVVVFKFTIHKKVESAVQKKTFLMFNLFLVVVSCFLSAYMAFCLFVYTRMFRLKDPYASPLPFLL